MNSPDRDIFPLPKDDLSGMPHWHDHRRNRQRATPLSTGIVDLRTAEALFQLYVKHR